MRFAILLLALLFLPLAHANAQWPGSSGRDSYVFTATAQISTLSGFITFDAPATRGFRVAQICYTSPSVTAAAATTWYLRRTAAASTGGTAVGVETGTGSGSPGNINKLNPSSPNWPGVTLYGGTPNSVGAVVDLWNVVTPQPATAAAVEGCRNYGLNGEQMPTVPAGITNGLALNFTGGGAGGLAALGLKVILILD